MSTISLRAFLSTAVLGITTAACVDAPDDVIDTTSDVEKQTVFSTNQVLVLELGKGEVTPLPPLVTNGTYQLASSVDVEAQQLLPATAYEAVQILQGLRDDPAETLFDLAEDAGVPAVGTIRDALPSALESRLYGWIDGYIQGVTTGDGTIAQVIDGVVSAAQTDIAHLGLDSTLSITDGAGVHRLDTVTLELQGQSLSYDVAPLASVGVELEVPVTATVDATNGLALGAHGFGFPYGKIAWRAIEDQVSARYGTDLRGLLGRQVDCAGMAAYVASRCYLGVCVGHESELNSICEAGLDYAVQKVREKVESAQVQPLALDAGTATMYDANLSDNVCSVIEGGVWSARLDVGNGLRAAPATFTGAR
ncbi:MAG: hypothetical protein F9K40_13475 [Kofleriaceae bacterium]|nr:MAG: hypothetical protein F9K40_13475 [Kofleriaceae bacterium]MBZ0230961.1 hypothetical protein [Kofleriaceae bacterium]